MGVTGFAYRNCDPEFQQSGESGGKWRPEPGEQERASDGSDSGFPPIDTQNGSRRDKLLDQKDKNRQPEQEQAATGQAICES